MGDFAGGLLLARELIPPGSTVLCAVSGGADSMCLLAWLLELGPKYGCAVAAAHYNHGLRGAQGDADDAVGAYIAGELKHDQSAVDIDEICGHDGGEGHEH